MGVDDADTERSDCVSSDPIVGSFNRITGTSKRWLGARVSAEGPIWVFKLTCGSSSISIGISADWPGDIPYSGLESMDGVIRCRCIVVGSHPDAGGWDTSSAQVTAFLAFWFVEIDRLMIPELSLLSSTLWFACPFDILDLQPLRTHPRHLVARDSDEMTPVHPVEEHSLRERNI